MEQPAPSQQLTWPLPNNQGLIVTGACSAACPLLPQAQLLLLGKGSSLCPCKFETIWTEGGSSMFTAVWTFPLPPQMLGENAPLPRTGRSWEAALAEGCAPGREFR